MAYVTKAEIEAVIPPQFLTEGLDDDSSGSADSGLFDLLVEQAENDVNSVLGQRYSAPFSSPVPPIAKRAARLFVCEAIYHRRGLHGDQNPWEKQAEKIRTKLDRIARGDEPLEPDIQREKPSASIITEDAKTHSAAGRTSI